MKPRNRPPKRSNGQPVPPLEVIEATGHRRRWPAGTPTVDLIPCGEIEVVEAFGHVQTLVDHLGRAKRLLAAGQWPTEGPALLATILPQLRKPRMWAAFDRTATALSPELAAEFLTAIGADLAAHWAQSTLDWQRAAAAAWLSAHPTAT